MSAEGEQETEKIAGFIVPLLGCCWALLLLLLGLSVIGGDYTGLGDGRDVVVVNVVLGWVKCSVMTRMLCREA